MTSKGLSQARLDRMHQVLSGHVERGDIPGMVALVSRHDEPHIEVLGNLRRSYVDPAEGVIGILLTQRLMDSPEPPRVFTDFWTQAYAAIE